MLVKGIWVMMQNLILWALLPFFCGSLGCQAIRARVQGLTGQLNCNKFILICNKFNLILGLPCSCVFVYWMLCLAVPGPGRALQPLVKMVLAGYDAPLGVPIVSR